MTLSKGENTHIAFGSVGQWQGRGWVVAGSWQGRDRGTAWEWNGMFESALIQVWAINP
jgi:hypothetical protein